MLMHADDRTRRESCCPEKTRASSHRQAGRRRRSVIDSAVASIHRKTEGYTQQAHFLLPVAHHAHVREVDGFLDFARSNEEGVARHHVSLKRRDMSFRGSREYSTREYKLLCKLLRVIQCYDFFVSAKRFRKQ